MLFSYASVLAAFAAVAAANTIEFRNQDSTERTIYFTPNAGLASIDTITLPGNGKETVSFPEAWIGNFFAVAKGAAVVPGMLGEVAWNGWAGANYFDISAIVNPNDNDNIKMLFPALSQLPLSGCETFPCSNAYNQPDDIQTLSTPESDLVCLVGNASGSSRKSRRHPRHFITGHSN